MEIIMVTNYSELISGHGRVVCTECKEVLISCRCINCGNNIIYTVCDECKEKKEGDDV